ncbi:MAG: carbohydrate ABC transporter permease [Clostridia bacterium]|nr:carbohydrate ABC transporter permease [Clostridia bacterium]
MASMNNESTPVVKRETKNSISVDFEGKLTSKERLMNKLKESNTWITAGVNLVRFLLMLGVSFVILYPFLARIANSFMTKEDVLDATVSLVPKNPTLEIYQAIIFENNYFEAFLNTLLLSLMCALVQMMVSCLVGYGLAKFKFKGNAVVMIAVIVTMVIPHSALQTSLMKHFAAFDLATVISWGYPGIIELITGQNGLDLTFTFWPLFILSIGGLAFKNGLYIYLMRQFFKGVPDELEESAYVDGSGVYRTFFQIILPLAVPMMITIFLFSFSWQWTDEFYHGLFFYTKDPRYQVLLMPDMYTTMPPSLIPPNGYGATTLYTNIVQNTAGMLIIAPLIIMYLFCQRYLVEGIERSGIVG